MPHLRPTAAPAPPPNPLLASPLVLCDRLITLAQDADRAGRPGTATTLIQLAHSVFDEPPAPRLS